MIPRLEDLPLSQRIVLTFLIVVSVLMILAAIGFLSGRWEAQGETHEQLYQGVPLNQHLLEADKKALEAAYQEHLKLLFSVWLKDDVSVVHRINTGLKRARQAYGDAAAKIEERERALKK